MKYAALAVIIALVSGYGIGRYLQPPKIEEKIVTKTVEKRDVKIITRTVTKKDGTVETVRTEEDNTVIIGDTKVESKLQSQPYKIDAIVGMHDLKPLYGASASKQFIGDISLGVFGLTNGTFGLTVGISF